MMAEEKAKVVTPPTNSPATTWQTLEAAIVAVLDAFAPVCGDHGRTVILAIIDPLCSIALNHYKGEALSDPFARILIESGAERPFEKRGAKLDKAREALKQESQKKDGDQS